MDRDLLERLYGYFSQIESPSKEQRELLRSLTAEQQFFPISSVSRDDLLSEGFDISGVSDNDMERLASEIGERCTSEMFWNALNDVADEELNIPRIDDTLYVLVEHPEDSSPFENEDIGYPCFNSEDNGARYVRIMDYIGCRKRYPATGTIFKPVRWPESQDFLEHDDERCEVVLADEKSLADFGSSAVWVPVELLNKEIR